MLSKEKERELTRVLGYRFRDRSLLETALTHSSYVNETGQPYRMNNERLEFLGDAVLDAVISEYLYEHYRDREEGFLTKERASIVCEGSLAACGRDIRLGSYLFLGRGEDHNGGRERQSMIADGVEALIGAVFLDGGWEEAKAFALRLLSGVIRQALGGRLAKDYKSQLQEAYQSEGETEIVYTVKKEEGPDHDKTFYVELTINGAYGGRGTGKSKKEAEQNAAREACKRLSEPKNRTGRE